MEKNFDDMTTKELKTLKDLLTIKINEKEEKEKINEKNEIYILLAKIEEICDKYNFSLFDDVGEEIWINTIIIE